MQIIHGLFQKKMEKFGIVDIILYLCTLKIVLCPEN